MFAELEMPRDARLLFAARVIRVAAYGALSVVLVLYLAAAGLTEKQIGWLLTLTLVGDVVISVALATRADRLGRRQVLRAGAWLMLVAGLIFAVPGIPFVALLITATIGVISPSGYEVGPFLPVEQAALSQLVPQHHRTATFGWYTLFGALASAAGAMIAGSAAWIAYHSHHSAASGQRAVLVIYALSAIGLLLLFSRLSPAAESLPSTRSAAPTDPWHAITGLHQNRATVLHLSALFALDAFGGAFVVQSLLAYYFHIRFGANIAELGGLFFATNIMAGLSALLATRIAARIGLVRTMVFTHLPSNLLLILVPLMPTYPLAAALLVMRFTISQMDVPARQSYTMAVVAPDERSSAAAVTGVARTAGAALAPVLATPLIADPHLAALPFFIAGGLKIIYDLLLWRAFDAVKLPE